MKLGEEWELGMFIILSLKIIISCTSENAYKF
jgi:hypothetical protein